MADKPYFPLLYGDVACDACEINAKCICFGKHQRNRRDFTYTSGRCPRLPDLRGFVEKSERDLYAATFPLVHAELGYDSLDLTLTLPGEKRMRKVYQTKSGYWYYRSKGPDDYYIRKVITIEGYRDKDEIIDHMQHIWADYCVLRCTIMGYSV